MFFQEPERRMLVGVPGEGRVLHRLLQLEERRGGVLVVLAEHGSGLFRKTPPALIVLADSSNRSDSISTAVPKAVAGIVV